MPSAPSSPLRSLSRETLIYGLSTIVGRFLNFILVPFYVNVLATRVEFGLQTSLFAYMAFFAVILPLGMEGAYFRYAARSENANIDHDQERRLLSTPFWLVFVFGFICALLIYFLAPHLVKLAFADPQNNLNSFVPLLEEILRWAAFILWVDALALVPFAALRLEHRAQVFAAIKISNIVLTLILNFFFIMKLHWGVAGIFRANAIASLLTLLAVLYCCKDRIGFCFDRNILYKMLPFGLGNVPAYLAAMMVQVIDRPIVQRLQGLDEAAVYQANYRMGIAMMVLVSVFDYAWRPFFMRQYKTQGDASKALFARVFTYTNLGFMLGFMFFSFLLPWLVGVRLPMINHSLLRADYLSGISIIPVVLLAYVFQGCYTNFIVGIYIREKSRYLPLVTGLGAIVNIGCNLWLIPWLGIMGAAIATLAAYLMMALALYTVSHRLYPIAYQWQKITVIYLLVLPATAAGLYSNQGMVKIGLFIAVSLVFWVIGYFPGKKIIKTSH